jgi:uncharacterized protein (DUF2147 family)
MPNPRLLLLATAVAALPTALVAAEPTPFGEWARGDGLAHVRIERCGADLCAVNTWIKAGTSGEHTGDKLVMSVKPAGPARWSGTAFDPQRDLSYRISIDLAATRMTTHGCVLAGLLCKDMGWTRLAAE